jgi:two-component system, OmpR family, sensor histidine kinase BaeS
MWHALRSLRSRFILSHVLPLLIIVPLMGIALIYALETQVLLRSMGTDLTGMAALLARLSGNQPALWTDSQEAQNFVDQIAPQVNASLALFDARGQVLATSGPANRILSGSDPRPEGLGRGLAGHLDLRVGFSREANAQVVAVTAPVLGANGKVLGVIYLTRQVAGLYDQFVRLRFLIGGILLAGLLLGTALGWLLALDLQAPLTHLTDAVAQLAAGKPWVALAPGGPPEVRLLTQTVNDLVTGMHALEAHRRELLANLVHEIGRPLGSASLAVQALRRGADQDPLLRQEFLAGIDGEIGRLRRLLDDLTRLYDQVTGTRQLVRQPVPLSPWLCSIVPVWHAAAEGRGLAWLAAVPEDLPVVEIDADRMAQALGNLLSNAIQYTPPGGQVCLEAGADPEGVWMAVSDTGPGIPPEEAERIFEPLQRGRQRGRFPQGMGLGLTIARDLVRAHGGRLDLANRPGPGSRFTIWLPLN